MKHMITLIVSLIITICIGMVLATVEMSINATCIGIVMMCIGILVCSVEAKMPFDDE